MADCNASSKIHDDRQAGLDLKNSQVTTYKSTRSPIVLYSDALESVYIKRHLTTAVDYEAYVPSSGSYIYLAQ